MGPRPKLTRRRPSPWTKYCKNDPNAWSEEPRYIVDLLKRIVRVSVESARIVKSLPPLNEAVD